MLWFGGAGRRVLLGLLVVEVVHCGKGFLDLRLQQSKVAVMGHAIPASISG
jgi:hypothetical protein